MAALRELRLFVCLGQIFGLIPFSMELDPSSGLFRRFTFSIRSYITWWYAFVAVAQLVTYISGAILVTQFYSSDTFSTHKLPPAVTMLIGASQVVYSLIFLLAWLTTLRYARFRKAVELVQQVEQHLTEVPECKNTVFLRTIVGFIFVVIANIAVFFSSLGLSQLFYTSMESFLPMGAFQFFIMMMVGCSFLQIHLSYYIISHYIRLLTTSLTKNLDLPSKAFSGEVERLRRSQQIFGLLCQAVTELNRIFSFPALFAISSKLVTSISGLFLMIYHLRTPIPIIDKAFWLWPASLAIDVFTIALYFVSSDMPVRQAKLLKEQVIFLSNTTTPQSVDLKVEVIAFLLQIDEDRIRLAACGLFKVGMHLVPGLVASIVTYLVILLQMQ